MNGARSSAADAAAGASEGTSARAATESAMRLLRTMTDATVRGAKQTLKASRSATLAVISDMTKLSAKVPRGNTFMKKMNIRKAFRARHSGALGAVAHVDDDEDDESSDSEEEFTDEQVREHVDGKYFDPKFSGTDAELTQLTASYADEDAEVVRELEGLDALVRDRSAQIRVVNSTLKKRILRNYDVFIRGVVQISDVNEDLLKIREECAQGRRRISQAKQSFVVEGLAIPINRRRRAHLRALQALVEQMSEFHDRHSTLIAMLDARKFTEAIAIVREPLACADLSALRAVASMRPLIEQWDGFAAPQSPALLELTDAAIEECITARFRASRYKEALEAALMLGDQENAFNKVVVSLYRTPEVIIFRSVAEVSEVREESRGLRAAIQGVAPEHLMLCLCQLSGKLANFLATFSCIVRCHTEETRHSLDEDRVAMHQQALTYVRTVGRKIGFNLHAKLVEVLEGAPFEALDLETVLHCFHLVMMLVEGTTVLGCDKDSMAAARAGVKRCVMHYIASTYQPQRGGHVAQFMEGELWEADEQRGSTLQLVAPISPESYKACVRSIKQFVAGWDADGDSPRPENPFFTPAFMSPQNVTDGITIVAFTPSPGRDVLTAAAVHVANCIFEYVCRAAVRFPPLAGEVLDWCEDLASLYIYVAAANFVSVSRSTPLEEQGDFSTDARAHLARMRKYALRAAPHLARPGADGLPAFPPAVFQGIEEIYSSHAEHFALVHRAVAVESGMPLVRVLRGALDSVAPLLSIGVQREKKASLDALEVCCEELLHVGMHRLSAAVFPTEDLVSDIAKTKFDTRGELRPSAYVGRLVTVAKNFYATFALTFPSPYLRDVFWARLVFTLQQALCRGFAKATKKASDGLVSQFMVDAQGLLQRLREFMPAKHVVLPDHCSTLLKAFFEDREGRAQWLRRHHEMYTRNDLVQWLSGGERDQRHELERLLDELSHTDATPVRPFVVALSPT